MTEPRWPAGAGPRVLVADGWWANAGDAAIGLAMAASLHRLLGEIRLVFCVHHRPLVGPHYPELDLVDPLHELVDAAPGFVAAADAVISQGGGFLFEPYGPGFRLAAYRRVVEMGVPLAFWAQSVGWFGDPALRRELSACWDSARTVIARDRPSAEHVVAAGAVRRPAVTADEALLLGARGPEAPSGVVGIALNDRPAAAVPWTQRAAPRNGALDRHAELVERLVASGRRIRAFSTVQDLDGAPSGVDNDAAHHRALLAVLPADVAAEVEVVDGYVTPARFRSLARGLEAVVSERMHAAMLAMLEGVPAVFASPSFTGAALFAALELERFVVPDGDPPTTVDSLAAASAVRGSLPDRIRRARRAAAANAVLVSQALRLLDDRA